MRLWNAVSAFATGLRFAQRNLSGRAAVIAVLEDWPAICSVVVAVGSMIMIGIKLYNDLQP